MYRKRGKSFHLVLAIVLRALFGKELIHQNKFERGNPIQNLHKLGGIQLMHDKVAIFYEKNNALIFQECRLRRQLLVQLFL